MKYIILQKFKTKKEFLKTFDGTYYIHLTSFLGESRIFHFWHITNDSIPFPPSSKHTRIYPILIESGSYFSSEKADGFIAKNKAYILDQIIEEIL